MPHQKNETKTNEWNKVIIRLKTIAEPIRNSRKIVEIMLPETVFFVGDGITSYLCGKCGCELAKNIDDGLLSNLVLKCNKCYSYNDIPARKNRF